MMNKKKEDIQELVNTFLEYFDDKDKQVIIFLIRQGLLKESCLRNYCLVLQMKELQFVKNYAYSKSMSIMAKKYGITTRRVREIYRTYMHFKVANLG